MHCNVILVCLLELFTAWARIAEALLGLLASWHRHWTAHNVIWHAGKGKGWGVTW